MNLKRHIDRWIDWGVDIPASPWQLAALFAVTVILRNLMESLTLGMVFPAPAFLLHFPVAYVYPLLTLVFVMRVFSGYDTAKLLKIMILAWTLTLLPPLIDAIAGTTSDIGYFPLERSNASWFLLNFFNPMVRLSGTTTGIRIEAAVGCILAGVFTWAVAPGKKLLRGILNALVFAPVFLTFFSWPYLVTILLQPFFPGDGLTHSLLQWHGSTEAPVTGASHYIVYLIDMIPVSLLSLWFVKELAGSRWQELKSKASSLAAPALSALAGTVAAFAVMPRAGITFADTVVTAGALLSALWISAGSSWKGSCRGVSHVVALTLAWACGWVTLVLAGLSIAVSGIPGPERLRKPLFSTALFVTALSPAGFSLVSTSGIGAIILVATLTLLTMRKTRLLFLFLVPMAVVALFPPASNTDATQRGLARRTDTFSRSGRIALAMESAARYAAAGGSWVPLAETTHLSGENVRSRYITETAIARGDSSASILKVAMNLAFVRGDTASFNSYFSSYRLLSDPSELNEAITMRVTFLALTGDTASLQGIHARAGMNPMVLRSMASAYLVNADTLRSLQYSLAFLGSPAAAANDWAKTITLAAFTGGASWDSIYTEAEEHLGYCLPVMLARLRAPVIAGMQPDRRDLLERCLLISSDGTEVLETAALWYSAAAIPDTALLYGSRVLAASRNPTRAHFSTVINSAIRAECFSEALAAAEYAQSLYSDNIEFLAVKNGLERGLYGAVPDENLQHIPWASALSDSKYKQMSCQITVFWNA
jgi:hypothetical protein